MSGALEEGGEGGGKSVEDRLRRLLGAATSRFDQMRVDIQEMTQYREKHDLLLKGMEELIEVGGRCIGTAVHWGVPWVLTGVFCTNSHHPKRPRNSGPISGCEVASGQEALRRRAPLHCWVYYLFEY